MDDKDMKRLTISLTPEQYEYVKRAAGVMFDGKLSQMVLYLIAGTMTIEYWRQPRHKMGKLLDWAEKHIKELEE
jgi:hypothetical protein